MNLSSRIAITVLFSFCFMAVIGQAQENKAIQQISVVSDEWKDYTNKDGSGAYWEVVKAVFEPLDIAVQTQIMPWARAELTVKRQQADALLGSYYQGNQLDTFIFPKWHISMEDSIIALHKINNDIQFQSENLQSLQGKRLIWVRGYEFEKTLFSGMTVNKHVISKPKQAIIMLERNRADVFIDYESSIRQAALETQLTLDTQYRMQVIKKGNKLYLAFSNTARGKRLSKLFDQQMETLTSTGAIQAIYTRWKMPNNKFLP